jgi:site-specific DNA recombinase
MINNEPSRAGFYARVSGDQQVKEETIASQIEALGHRIQEDGLRLEEELSFVEDGYSGKTLVRPALERLRDVAAAGGLDRLYVHSPDRLARKYAYQVLLVEELRRGGVEVIFLNRQIGTSPEDDLLLQVQGMVAEYERAKILERSRRGKRHAASRGRVNVLSGAPYGYRYIRKYDGGGEAGYQVVFEQARVVRQIFEWVGRDRWSIGEVCRRLAHEGIPSPRGKGYWDRTTVWGILKNPAYKGSAAFGKTRTGEMRPRLRPQRGRAEQPRRAYSVYDVPREDWMGIPVPAITDEALFDAVAEQLAENRLRNRQTQRGARYLLQGLLVCQGCGHAFYGKALSLSAGKGKRRDYAYYRCIGMDAYRFGGQRICANRQVRTDLLEEAVWEDVRSLLTEPERIEREYQRRLDDKSKDCGSQTRPSLATVITRIQRAIARLIDAYEDGLLERAEFVPRINSARDRLAKLKVEAQAQAEQETEEQHLRLAIGQLKDFADKVKDGLQGTDWMTRREVIRALVKRVEIDQENVRVVYKVSPSPFADSPERGIMQHCWRRERRALRRTSPVVLVPCRSMPVAPLVDFLDGGFQPHLQQMQHGPVHDASRQASHQLRMGNAVEVPAQIRIDHLRVPAVEQVSHLVNRVQRAPVWPVGVLLGLQVGLEDGF